jgi:hypothetical protein
MAEREADRVRPDRLREQAVAALRRRMLLVIETVKKNQWPLLIAPLLRAMAAMAEFARLRNSPDGTLVVEREAQLISPANPRATQTKLLRLLEQHRAEWSAFVNSLPERSWVRDMVGQL